ncbi:MAG: hypothetical protein HYT20_03070 [Candidatus Nealsonbacteria bacterium]|nr:hypothetical protein [Candidatus Nealsonbacteria bacterium]
MSKYKYYFAKPRSEIVKDALKGLAVTGAICIAATSPYFATNLLRGLQNGKKYNKSKKIYDTFYNLKRQGYINIENKNHQIYISLTREGKKKAGRFQIDSLKINKPKKWDKKWRLVIFDIAQLKRLQRNAFRGKLKELGFCPLQKSVWVHPYKCNDEIGLLREFFGLSQKEIRLIIAEDIEEERFLRKIFKLI